MSVHLFHFQWQALQFDEAKKQLQIGDILLIMDFAYELLSSQAR